VGVGGGGGCGMRCNGHDTMCSSSFSFRGDMHWMAGTVLQKGLRKNPKE
jgi:hypothetical protein